MGTHPTSEGGHRSRSTRLGKPAHEGVPITRC
jgi:hypothetical protein